MFAVALFAGGIVVLMGGVVITQAAFVLGVITSFLGFTLMVATAAILAGLWKHRKLDPSLLT